MVATVHITEAESVILDVLWRAGPQTPARLIEQVKAVRPWADATIKTLLGRLMQKHAVASEREDGRFQYRALVERSAYVEGEVDALVDRLFGGDPARLAAWLSARTSGT